MFCCPQCYLQPQVGPLHCCKVVDNKQNQKKTVCSGDSALRKIEILPQSFPPIGLPFYLIVQNGHMFSPVQQPMMELQSSLLALSIKTCPQSWDPYIYPYIYCQQMNISGQTEVSATGTYWKEKGRIGEDSICE